MYHDQFNVLRLTAKESKLSTAEQARIVRAELDAIKAGSPVLRATSTRDAVAAAEAYFDGATKGQS